MKKKLPGTIVINNSCESLKTDKLWNVFKKKGAATYFGYSGNVRNEFAVLMQTIDCGGKFLYDMCKVWRWHMIQRSEYLENLSSFGINSSLK